MFEKCLLTFLDHLMYPPGNLKICLILSISLTFHTTHRRPHFYFLGDFPLDPTNPIISICFIGFHFVLFKEHIGIKKFKQILICYWNAIGARSFSGPLSELLASWSYSLRDSVHAAKEAEPLHGAYLDSACHALA